MKRIPIGTDHVAYIDDDDYELVSELKWWPLRCAGGLVYAQSKNPKSGRGIPKTILMHRLIMDAPRSKTVDHVDGNGLNNTRENLRLATLHEQQKNRRLNTNNKSGFKGVYETKTETPNKWRAETRVNGKKIHIGHFENPRDAAIAYNAVVNLLHGKFASLNKIDGVSIGNGNYRPRDASTGKFRSRSHD